MELVKCFLTYENIIDSGNVIYSKHQKGHKNFEYISISLLATNDVFTYCCSEKVESSKNTDITYYNTCKIKELAFKNDLNIRDIKKGIINKFHDNKLFLFIYTKKQYNNIYEMGNLIFNINNQLCDLEETIKVYFINNENDYLDYLLCVDELKYIKIGEKKIPIELEKEKQKFKYSASFGNLTSKLIRKKTIIDILKDDYNVKYYCNCDKYNNIYVSRNNDICYKCKIDSNKQIDDYNKCIKVLKSI